VVLITSFNKKGQTFIDILVVAIILLVAATSFVLMTVVQKEITAEFQKDEAFNASTDAGQALANFDENYSTMLDNTFLVVFVLLWVFVIVSSLFVDASPIFLIVSFVLLVIVLVAMGVMSNTYQEFIEDGDIYTFSAGFPKTNYIMEHLLLFCVFIAFTGLIAIYGKNTLGGGGYG